MDSNLQRWRTSPRKYFDFNQINGDFINLIQLKHYQRENKNQNFCSSIFLSLHQGYQVVIWEATNYPKIKMKLIWFYVVIDQIQPFCAAEIPYIDLTTTTSSPQQYNQQTQYQDDEPSLVQINGDVVMGFEQGKIKLFDFSHHFKDQRFQAEVRHSFFVGQSTLQK